MKISKSFLLSLVFFAIWTYKDFGKVQAAVDLCKYILVFNFFYQVLNFFGGDPKDPCRYFSCDLRTINHMALKKCAPNIF